MSKEKDVYYSISSFMQNMEKKALMLLLKTGWLGHSISL